MSQDHWLPGFNFNVEEWDAKGLHYETLAICGTSPRPAPPSQLRRHVHDPAAHPRGEAAPGGRLVSAK
jgi:hypothetical protein